MLTSGWGMIFNLFQLLDPVVDVADGNVEIPIWPLAEDEAKQLGNATTLYIESIPSNQKSRIKDFIEKHLPLIMLTGTIAQVAGPRAHFSFEQKRSNLRAKALAAKNGGSGNVRPGSIAHAATANAEGNHNASAGPDAGGVSAAHSDGALTDAFTRA